MFLIILGLFSGISRAGAGLLQKLNRHALDLERVIDVEAKFQQRSRVPTEIRGSKLYNHTIGKRTEAFQDRHSKIIESDEIIDKRNQNYQIFQTRKVGGERLRNLKINLDYFSSLQNNLLDMLVAHRSNYRY